MKNDLQNLDCLRGSCCADRLQLSRAGEVGCDPQQSAVINQMGCATCRRHQQCDANQPNDNLTTDIRRVSISQRPKPRFIAGPQRCGPT